MQRPPIVPQKQVRSTKDGTCKKTCQTVTYGCSTTKGLGVHVRCEPTEREKTEGEAWGGKDGGGSETDTWRWAELMLQKQTHAVAVPVRLLPTNKTAKKEARLCRS